MVLDPKILILEQSRKEATRIIESGHENPRDGESKTKAINRISEEIFFKKLQENVAKQNHITNTNKTSVLTGFAPIVNCESLVSKSPENKTDLFGVST